MPRIPQRCGKFLTRCPIQGQESSVVEPRGPSMPQVIQALGNPSIRPLHKQSVSQGTPIFQHGSLKGASRGNALKERWLEGLRYAFSAPNIIQMALGRGPDHDHTLLARSKKFPEFMHLPVEPPRRFRPSQWLLWNATTWEEIPKVMKSIQLTAWMLTSSSMPKVASERKLLGKSLIPGQEVSSRTTRGCLNSSVLSAMEEGYQSLKFV